MTKNILKLLLSFSLILTSANALKKDEIESQMTKKIDKMLEILAIKDMPKKEKGEKLVAILDDVFDYEKMSKISLGRTWKKISQKQKKEFSVIFEKKLKQSYIDKLDLYKGQKVKVLGLHPYKKSRLQLKAQLKGKDEDYPVNYNFHQNKQSKQWLVYDVQIAGVSIMRTYRDEYTEFLRSKSFEQLLKTLKSK